MATLPDHEIAALGSGLVQPFNEDHVQPASIDMQLGNRFRVYDTHGLMTVDLSDPAEEMTKLVEVGEEGFVLHPGEFVLGRTEERVTIPRDIVARIEGKSSLGRLGLIVHATAGFIDPGYNGVITLEMTNLLRVPIILRPGKLICQVSFMKMESPAKYPYDGRYQGDDDVVASRYGTMADGVGEFGLAGHPGPDADPEKWMHKGGEH